MGSRFGSNLNWAHFCKNGKLQGNVAGVSDHFLIFPARFCQVRQDNATDWFSVLLPSQGNPISSTSPEYKGFLFTTSPMTEQRKSSNVMAALHWIFKQTIT